MKKALLIAKYTFKEIIKSKILLNVFLLGIALFIVTYVAYNFTYGEPSRVALDFGLGILSLSSVAIALFIGVGLLSEELKNRTVYMIISRPVPRHSFILGKIMGLIGVLIVNILLLSILTLLCFFFTGGEYSSLISWTILYTVLDAIIVLLLVSFFSLLTSPILSVIFTIGLYISGHAIDAAKATTFAKNAPGLEEVISLYQFILPAFHKLNIKDFVLYKQNLEWSFLVSTFGYGVLYALFLVFVSIVVFEKKNIN